MQTTSTATRVRYQVMAFLCVLAFLTYFDRVCITRAQEDIQRDLTISDEDMGLILGAFWLAYSLFEIPAGWMGDRFGARLTLTRIVLAWSVLTALSGTATGFLSLLLYRFLFGVGEAGAFPNMARVQENWLPLASRGRASGLLWLVARWGGAFAPILFGSFLTLFDSARFRGTLRSVPGLSALADVASWRLSFLAAGLLGAIWCIAFFFWFRDDPAEKRGVNAAELELIRAGRAERAEREEGASSHRLGPTPWKALFTSQSMWAMALLYVTSSFAFSFYVSWLPRYLKDVHHLQFQKSELQTGLPLFCGGLACFVGGFLSDLLVRRTNRKWLGRALFPITGYLVAGAAMYALPSTQTKEQAVVLLCVAGAFHDFGQGANWATIVDMGGAYAGTAAGFINMVGNAGNYLQPVIGASIFNTYGWGSLFVVYSCMYVFSACMWFFIRPDRRFYEGKQN